MPHDKSNIKPRRALAIPDGIPACRSSHRIRVAFFIGVVATLALASLARADGVYIPLKAYPVLPTIPVQRAIIIQRNGTETLIVESAFQSQSPDVAWILPLPAAPTKLEHIESGAISSTAFSLRPEIVTDQSRRVNVTFLIMLVIVPYCVVSIVTPDPGARHARCLTVFLADIVLLLLSMLVPSMGSAGPPLATPELPGLAILSSQRLDDADFTVLNATTPEVLDQWLAGQGMWPLDAPARPIVADYIARHWCFVVGRMHNGASGFSIPRPLMVTFPADVPVFPMKLTALANTTTHVEMCVVAADQAAAPGFRCVVADRYHRADIDPHASIFGKADCYAGDYTRTTLGHPDIIPLLWDNCVATKLTADLPPAQMDRDITIQFQPLKSQRQKFFSGVAPLQGVWAAAQAGITIFCLLAAVFLRGGRKPSPRQFRILVECILAVLIAAPIASWLIFPTIPAHVSGRSAREWPSDMAMSGIDWAKKGLITETMTPDQMIDAIKIAAKSSGASPEFLQNPYTGQPIRAECSPGNIAIRTIGDKTYFCTYNENGVELRMRMPQPDVPATQTTQGTP